MERVPHFNEGGNVATGMEGIIGMMGPTGMMGASGMDGATEMLINLGLPGLGGGGGGTNAITDKAMNKSVGTRTRDIGNLFARPFRKGTTDPRSNFASDIVPGFEGGGLVGGKNFIQSVKNRDYGWSVKPPKPSIVQAYKDEQSKSKIIGVGGGGNTESRSKGGNDLPEINAAAKRSLPKIKTLGISV